MSRERLNPLPLPDISPLQFFHWKGTFYPVDRDSRLHLTEDHLLADTTGFTNQKETVRVLCGWSNEGLAFDFAVSASRRKSLYPQLELGDAIEIFIDTRDMKTSSHNTRFCHHFFFLAHEVEGIEGREKTYFRNNQDRHEYCTPEDIEVIDEEIPEGYRKKIWIPSRILHGYDPEQFDRIGFHYCVHFHRGGRIGGEKQELAASQEQLPVSRNPSLWASIQLDRSTMQQPS